MREARVSILERHGCFAARIYLRLPPSQSKQPLYPKSKAPMSAIENYEKLQLAKQDLQYLFNQMRQDMTAKLDYHVPGSGPHDPLKLAVEDQLDGLLVQTFEMAKSALVVDGRDLHDEKVDMKELLAFETEEEVAPFDSQLNNSLRAIIGKVEQETTSFTTLRRELPRRAAEAYEDLIHSIDKEVTMALVELDSEGQKEVDEGENEVHKAIPNLDEIVDDYERSLALLNDCKRTIPVKRAELDSLNEIIKFLEASYEEQQKDND